MRTVIATCPIVSLHCGASGAGRWRPLVRSEVWLRVTGAARPIKQESCRCALQGVAVSSCRCCGHENARSGCHLTDVVTLMIQFALFFSSAVKPAIWYSFISYCFILAWILHKNLTWKLSFPRKPPPSPQTPWLQFLSIHLLWRDFTVKLFNILISTFEVLLFLKLSALSLKNDSWMWGTKYSRWIQADQSRQ